MGCMLLQLEDPVKIRINWSYLHFPEGTYTLRDLWQKEDIGTTETNFVGTVKPHDVILLTLTPVK